MMKAVNVERKKRSVRLPTTMSTSVITRAEGTSPMPGSVSPKPTVETVITVM